MTDKVVYGTALSPEDLSEQVVAKPLPGGWTTSDLDLSPWIQTIYWEVALCAGRPLEDKPGNVNGRKPCKVEIESGWGRVLCGVPSITLVYPEFTNAQGNFCTIRNIWPFPIKNAPKALVERTVAELDKALRRMDLLAE